MARALKFQSNLPNSFWGDFILTATHIINLLPVKSLQFKTPFELLYQKTPNHLHLKSFGCLCYATKLHPTDKLDVRAIKGVFIGYPFNKKGYKILNLQSRQCFFSRDVQFVEHEFPFHKQVSEVYPPSSVDHPLFPEAVDTVPDPIPVDVTPTIEVTVPPAESSAAAGASPVEATAANSHPGVPITRPVRQKQLPARFKDFTGLPSAHTSCLHLHCPQDMVPLILFRIICLMTNLLLNIKSIWLQLIRYQLPTHSLRLLHILNGFRL